MAIPRYVYYRMFGYVFTIVVHSLNLVYMTGRLQGDVMEDPVIKSFSDLQARYFTCWTFAIQMFYSAVGLVCDALMIRYSGKNNYKLPKHLQAFRDTLFSGIQWPANCLVFTIFWSMFFYDRNLILPPIIDRVLTRTSNHIIHTLIIPIVVWELVFRPRPVPKSHARNLKHMLFQLGLYFAVLFYTYYKRGVWLYPIFGKLYGTIFLPLFFFFVLALLVFFYYSQWYLTRLVWGDLTSERVKKML